MAEKLSGEVICYDYKIAYLADEINKPMKQKYSTNIKRRQFTISVKNNNIRIFGLMVETDKENISIKIRYLFTTKLEIILN